MKGPYLLAEHFIVQACQPDLEGVQSQNVGRTAIARRMGWFGCALLLILQVSVARAQNVACPSGVPATYKQCAPLAYAPWSYTPTQIGGEYPDSGSARSAAKEQLYPMPNIFYCSASFSGDDKYSCSAALNNCHAYAGQPTQLNTNFGITLTSQVPTCTDPVVQSFISVSQIRPVVCPVGFVLLGSGQVLTGSGPVGSTLAASPAVDNLSTCASIDPVKRGKGLGGCSGDGGSGGSGGSMIGNPINAGIGNKVQAEVDYPGTGDGVRFVRTYNSGGVVQAAGSVDYGAAWLSQIGYYWRHSYDRSLVPMTSGGVATILAYRPDGRIVSFNLVGSAYVADSDISDRLVALSGGTGWKFTTSADETEIYDTSGKLQSITSRRGIVQTMTYSTASTPVSVAPVPGLLITVTDSFGRALNFTYDSSARIVTMKDPANGVYQYAYGTANNLTSVTYPDTTGRTYLYDEAAYVAGVDEPNALTGIIDENNVRYATYQYDSSGRATFTGHAAGADSNTLVHNADGTVTATDPLGKVRTYAFSTINGLRKTTSVSALCGTCGGSSASSMGYDANGNVTSKTDFNGNVTNFVFDLIRNLETSRTEAFGTPRARTITTAWDPTFRSPALITEPNRTTGYTYDTSGNVLTKTITDTTVTPNVTRVWTYTYNSFGKVLTVDGPRTDVLDKTTYTYFNCTTGSQCGQINTITNAANQITTISAYNSHGQPLSITDPNGVLTTLAYDTRQRLTSRQVGSETTTFSYWPTGQLKKITLPDTSFVQYTYDNAHRLTDITDSLGNKIHYVLDAMGNRTAESAYDPSNVLARTQSRVFNNLGQLTQIIGAAGTAAVTTTLGYDNNGNQTTTNAPLTRNSVNAYDELDRLKQVTDPANGNTIFGYDANDNLTSVTDPGSLVTSYIYNGFGDVKQQASPATGTSNNTYDSGGNIKTAADARGVGSTYSYDTLNRVTQIAYGDQTIVYGYDVGTNGKGRFTSASDSLHSMSFVYDGLGRVTSKSQTVAGVTRTVGYSFTSGNLVTLMTPSGQSIGYSYTNGRVTGITINGTALLSNVVYEPFGPQRSWTWGNGSSESRLHDTDGNPSLFTGAEATSYSLDNAFRIQGITNSSTSSASWGYGYDALDRITSGTNAGNSVGWTIDANGNRLTQTGAASPVYATSNLTFTYNNRGRMTSAAASGTTNYIYNALGQRIEKTGPGGLTIFSYDELGHLLGEYTSTGALIEETIWLGDLPVATLRPNGASILIYYIHADHLGAPRSITRTTDNAIVWRWDTDPFGWAAPNQNPGGLGLFVYNLRYPGQYYDSESGLSYNYFRDYDSAVGRYVESDPIGLSGGSFSTYAYADGSPIVFRDSSGLLLDQFGTYTGVSAVGEATGVGLGVAAVGVTAAAAVGVGVGIGINVTVDHYTGDSIGGHIYDWLHHDPSLQQEIERGANQAEVHRICDEPPPPNLDPCERAKWILKKAQTCKVVRQAMTDRWFGGSFDQPHADHMKQLDRQIANAQRAVVNACKDDCKK